MCKLYVYTHVEDAIIITSKDQTPSGADGRFSKHSYHRADRLLLFVIVQSGPRGIVP